MTGAQNGLPCVNPAAPLHLNRWGIWHSNAGSTTPFNSLYMLTSPEALE